MNFQPGLVKAILEGRKTQTRRLVKPGDLSSTGNAPGAIQWVSNTKRLTGGRTQARFRWFVGSDYAVCPGRGKAQVARIRLLSIRREDVRDISQEDAVAEACWVASPENARPFFWDVWVGIYDRDIVPYTIVPPPHEHLMERPAELYQAWVLDFELIT